MAKKADAKLDGAMRIVVLYGKEDMLKRARLHELREALAEAHGEVETFTFDGKTDALADVLDELRGYSLMMTYKLVIVDEADQFLKLHREAIERYAEAPVDHATLVLRAATWNRGNLDKKIEKVGAIVKCEPMKPGEATLWVVGRAKSEYRTKIDRDAAGLLVQRLGSDLLTLDSELAKLSLMVGEGEAIDAALVEKSVGRGSEEQAWAVQEAILTAMQRGDRGGAVSAVHELVDVAGQPEVLVTYFVADLMRKLALAQQMKRGGAPDVAIAKAMKLWGPRQQVFMAVLRGLGDRDASGDLARVLDYDARSKSGLGEAMRNLECFCVGLSDKSR